jgi:predicted RNase H-like HicB family nuclease
MASRLTLTAVYEPVEHGWIQAHLTELPGVITAAPTLAEAKELLADALREYLLALGEAEGAPAQLPAGATSEAGALEVVIDAA